MSFECTKCRYKIQKDKIPRRCPYCSAEGAVRKIPTAQDWIDELE